MASGKVMNFSMAKQGKPMRICRECVHFKTPGLCYRLRPKDTDPVTGYPKNSKILEARSERWGIFGFGLPFTCGPKGRYWMRG